MNAFDLAASGKGKWAPLVKAINDSRKKGLDDKKIVSVFKREGIDLVIIDDGFWIPLAQGKRLASAVFR